MHTAVAREPCRGMLRQPTLQYSGQQYSQEWGLEFKFRICNKCKWTEMRLCRQPCPHSSSNGSSNISNGMHGLCSLTMHAVNMVCGYCCAAGLAGARMPWSHIGFRVSNNTAQQCLRSASLPRTHIALMTPAGVVNVVGFADS